MFFLSQAVVEKETEWKRKCAVVQLSSNGDVDAVMSWPKIRRSFVVVKNLSRNLC